MTNGKKKAEAEPNLLPPAVPARLQLTAEPPTMLDGNVHVGVAIGLTTSGKPSALVVPDVAGVGKGTAPVYLTKPLRIELENILNYLESKAPGTKKTLQENKALSGFLKNTSVSIDSFYYRKAPDPTPPATEKGAGILLMQFALNFTKGEGQGGLIGDLTGDENLSKLFDVTGIALRVLQCGTDDVKVLQYYVDALSAE